MNTWGIFARYPLPSARPPRRPVKPVLKPSQNRVKPALKPSQNRVKPAPAPAGAGQHRAAPPEAA